MKILIAGATGFIGRNLVAYLQGRGHSITAWVRDESKARNLLGDDIKFIRTSDPSEVLKEELELTDAVINLSGRSIAGTRWTAKKKREFWDSRVGVAKLFSQTMNQCESPPKVLVSASAIGYYAKSTGPIDEENGVCATDYLGSLCNEWEEGASEAGKCGTRVCLLRIGLVLGRDGLMLRQIARIARLGISAYVGNGSQVQSWIHIADIVKIIVLCMENEELSGAVNGTAPYPVTAKEMASAILAVTKAKLLLRVPTILLRFILGDASTLLSTSQNVSPVKLQRLGYAFQHTRIDGALQEEFGRG